jgi:drug/metabolite transporter (DMT)-like permease
VTALQIGLGATIGCALLWAVLDVLRKQLAARMSPVGLTVWLAIGQAPFLLAWIAYVGPGTIAPAWWPWAIATIAVNIIAAILYLVAVGSGQFSVAIPMLAFVPVWTAALGVPVLQQVPTTTQLVGIAMVVGGAIVLHGQGRSGLALFSALVRERASVAMLGVALCWAATIVLDKRATEHAPLSIHALALSVGIASGAGGWLLARGRIRDLGQAVRAPWHLVAAAIVAAVAMVLQLRAMQDVDVAVLEAVKRTVGMIAAIVLGRAAFAEPITVRKLGAVALMTAGALLVTGALW